MATEKENLESESKQEKVEEGSNYIEALKEMKKNSVPRESYEKLKRENKELLDSLVNGKEIEVKKEEEVNIPDLRKKLFNKDKQMTNLEYVTNALKLRDALLEKGERDPFLPYGEKVSLTAEHIETAERVATVLKECVEFADGDSGIFSAELQRRTQETMPYRGKR